MQIELPELHLLYDLGFIAIGAAIFAFLGKLIRMPSLVAYILAGMCIGPGLGLVDMNHSLELITELGIALLLFLVGLELSLEKIKNLGKVALTLGALQVTLTALGGYLLSRLLGFNAITALFLAASVTFSSTVVVIKLLDQKGAMKRLYARVAIGLFLAQDIVVIVALTLMSGLGDGGDEVSILIMLQNVAKAFGGMLLMLLVSILAARFLLPKPFAWAARYPDTAFIWALCWCFLVVLLAHSFHLSVEIGAFLAGIAIAQLPVHEDLHQRLHPLMNAFIAVFLVGLGVNMEFADFPAIWPQALILSAFVLTLKPLIVFTILSKLKFSRYTGFQTALSTAQISEFSFILLGLAAGIGLVDSTTVSLVGLVGILTIGASSYAILSSEALFNYAERYGCFRFSTASETREPEAIHDRSGHIIVIGMNGLGREIVQQLVARSETVLAIDTDPVKLQNLHGADTLIGNVEYHAVVEEIGMRNARLVISALQIEDANHLLAYRCRSMGVPCAIHAFDDSVVEDLLDLDANYLMMPAIAGAVQEVQQLREEGLLK